MSPSVPLVGPGVPTHRLGLAQTVVTPSDIVERSEIGEIRSEKASRTRLTWSNEVFCRPHEGGVEKLTRGRGRESDRDVEVDGLNAQREAPGAVRPSLAG